MGSIRYNVLSIFIIAIVFIHFTHVISAWTWKDVVSMIPKKDHDQIEGTKEAVRQITQILKASVQEVNNQEEALMEKEQKIDMNGRTNIEEEVVEDAKIEKSCSLTENDESTTICVPDSFFGHGCQCFLLEGLKSSFLSSDETSDEMSDSSSLHQRLWNSATPNTKNSYIKFIRIIRSGQLEVKIMHIRFRRYLHVIVVPLLKIALQIVNILVTGICICTCLGLFIRFTWYMLISLSGSVVKWFLVSSGCIRNKFGQYMLTLNRNNNYIDRGNGFDTFEAKDSKHSDDNDTEQVIQALKESKKKVISFVGPSLNLTQSGAASSENNKERLNKKIGDADIRNLEKGRKLYRQLFTALDEFTIYLMEQEQQDNSSEMRKDELKSTKVKNGVNGGQTMKKAPSPACRCSQVETANPIDLTVKDKAKSDSNEMQQTTRDMLNGRSDQYIHATHCNRPVTSPQGTSDLLWSTAAVKDFDLNSETSTISALKSWQKSKSNRVVQGRPSREMQHDREEDEVTNISMTSMPKSDATSMVIGEARQKSNGNRVKRKEVTSDNSSSSFPAGTNIVQDTMVLTPPPTRIKRLSPLNRSNHTNTIETRTPVTRRRSMHRNSRNDNNSDTTDSEASSTLTMQLRSGRTPSRPTANKNRTGAGGR